MLHYQESNRLALIDSVMSQPAGGGDEERSSSSLLCSGNQAVPVGRQSPDKEGIIRDNPSAD